MDSSNDKYRPQSLPDQMIRDEIAKQFRKTRRILRGNEPEIDTYHPKNPLLPIAGAVLVFLVVMWLVTGCARAETIEGYSINTWAEAIHHAEGNDNYGILAHYKHTSYKQACINTIRHKHSLWVKQGKPGAFLTFLGGLYCPVGADNDNGTNKYWIDNVKYWLYRIKGA